MNSQLMNHPSCFGEIIEVYQDQKTRPRHFAKHEAVQYRVWIKLYDAYDHCYACFFNQDLNEVLRKERKGNMYIKIVSSCGYIEILRENKT